MRVNAEQHNRSESRNFTCYFYYFFEGQAGILENGCENFSGKLVLSLKLLHSGRISRNILNLGFSKGKQMRGCGHSLRAFAEEALRGRGWCP